VNPSLSFAQALRRVLTLTTLVAAVALLWWAQRLLVPLALALLLAFVLRPVVSALEHRGLPRVAAVLLVVFLAFLLVGAVGFTVLRQVDDLGRELTRHEQNILDKLTQLGGPQGPVGRGVQALKGLRDEVQGAPAGAAPAMPGWLPVVARPVLETGADLALMVVLAVFVLAQREELRDRLIRLAGRGRLTATTRALDDTARRLSRYLFLLCALNAGFGAAVAVGLALLGVPYAPLWGVLVAVLRFIPYVGIWVAAFFPFALSGVVAPGWLQPASVLVLFLVLDLLFYHFLEPVAYGQSVGVVPLALLVAAAFWFWLWGPVGLLLSTPLTICLVVLGKYAPPLRFLDVLLGTEPPLDLTVHFYQRLLARDEDEAAELAEEYLQQHPLAALYDDVLLPALVLAGRDRERQVLSADDERFLLAALRDVIEDQEPAPPAEGATPARPAGQRLVLARAARSEADELALAMFRQLLRPLGCAVEVQSTGALAAEVVERAEQSCPFLVVIAAVPPGGLSQAAYLSRRLRCHGPQTKVLVGRWGQEERVEETRVRLRQAGADLVALTLREARDQVAALVQAGAPLPSPAPQPAA
jgi:predicted PurR-regulated permease PerM/CheY-like chemotaxis protein